MRGAALPHPIIFNGVTRDPPLYGAIRHFSNFSFVER
jgi:hypothetical protein